MPDENAKQMMVDSGKLFSDKQSWDSLQQEIALNFYAARADFTDDISDGEDYARHQTTAVPEYLRRELGNSLSSMLRPSGRRRWFGMTIEGMELKQAGRANLEARADVVSRILYDRRGCFRREVVRADHDFITFGVAVMSAIEHRKRNGLIWGTHHPRDCAWADDHEGKANRLDRKFKMSAYNLAKRFGKDKLPQSVKEALDQSPNKLFNVTHCCLPSDMYDAYEKKAKSKPFISVYILTGTEADGASTLGEMPEPRFLYVVPRWIRVGLGGLPSSPATAIGLPQARLVQEQALTILEAGQKAVDPPIKATEGAVKSAVDLQAGGVTYVDQMYDERLGSAIEPLQLQKNVPLGDAMMQATEEMLAQIMFINKLALPEGPQRTAFETAQLTSEHLRNALPVFEPIEDEYSGAILDNVYEYAELSGQFDELDENLPDELSKRETVYEYYTPIREAQRFGRVQAAGQVFDIIGAAGQIDPMAAKVVDVPKVTHDAIQSVPNSAAEWVVDLEQLKQEGADQQGLEEASSALSLLEQGAGAASASADAAERTGLSLVDLAGGGEEEETA